MALFGFSGKKKRQKTYIKEHHFLFVEALFQDVVEDILKWSWSSWWPTDICLKYETDDGEIEAGKPCRLVLRNKLFKAVLRGEIVQIRSQKALQFVWTSGLMTGQEFLIVEERSNGTRVDHRSRYAGKTILAKWIWLLMFRRKYNECIGQALEALKNSISGPSNDSN